MCCSKIEPQLTAFVLEELDPDDRRRVEAHLADCPDCRADVEEIRHTARRLESELAGEAALPGGPAVELTGQQRAAIESAAMSVREPGLADLGPGRQGSRRIIALVRNSALAASLLLAGFTAGWWIHARNVGRPQSLEASRAAAQVQVVYLPAPPPAAGTGIAEAGIALVSNDKGDNLILGTAANEFGQGANLFSYNATSTNGTMVGQQVTGYNVGPNFGGTAGAANGTFVSSGPNSAGVLALNNGSTLAIDNGGNGVTVANSTNPVTDLAVTNTMNSITGKAGAGQLAPAATLDVNGFNQTFSGGTAVNLNGGSLNLAGSGTVTSSTAGMTPANVVVSVGSFKANSGGILNLNATSPDLQILANSGSVTLDAVRTQCPLELQHLRVGGPEVALRKLDSQLRPLGQWALTPGRVEKLRLVVYVNSPGIYGVYESADDVRQMPDASAASQPGGK